MQFYDRKTRITQGQEKKAINSDLEDQGKLHNIDIV